MADVGADQGDVISGMPTLVAQSGLLTGAAVVGAVFALATRTIDIATASRRGRQV